MAIDASAVGKELPDTTFEYTDRDVMLYALGVGATADELNFVYEKDLQTLPTFGVIPAFPALAAVASAGSVRGSGPGASGPARYRRA